jgi:flagellar biosynthesis protein FliP
VVPYIHREKEHAPNKQQLVLAKPSSMKEFQSLIRLDNRNDGVHMMKVRLEETLAGFMTRQIKDAFACEVILVLLAKWC